MPSFAARVFTLSSRSFDNLIFTRSVFGLNSKRKGTIVDRSYSERSAVSTKRSASSSLLSLGSFLSFGCLALIMFDLLRVHVARTDWADQKLIPLYTQREDDEHAP